MLTMEAVIICAAQLLSMQRGESIQLFPTLQIIAQRAMLQKLKQLLNMFRYLWSLSTDIVFLQRWSRRRSMDSATTNGVGLWVHQSTIALRKSRNSSMKSKLKLADPPGLLLRTQRIGARAPIRQAATLSLTMATRNGTSQVVITFETETLTEPAMVTSGTWARPNRSPWAAPAAINDTPLSKPTNDIGAAVEYLKEAVTKPSSVTPAPAFAQPRFTVTVPRRETATVLPRRDAYTETIDSREAARRYSNFNGSSQPYTTGDPYGTTISSRDAMKKYNGTIV
ncbi:hypothetical protein L1049_020763 [Liquidambar formosana]|uniref:Uncharacterized protein n=1 Tax=Liquidambar formosana TaxID=63359 RepID=A0AAP0SAF5_LIQFO